MKKQVINYLFFWLVSYQSFNLKRKSSQIYNYASIFMLTFVNATLENHN